MSTEIDPVQYGQLLAKVGTLEGQVSAMQADIKQLLEMANKSKGGMWFGMAIVSGLGSLIGFFGHMFFQK